MEPGSPWENGYAESFHSRLRDEFLAVEMFESLSAARRLTASWQTDYNHHRPHGSLGYQTPAHSPPRVASVPALAAPPACAPAAHAKKRNSVTHSPTHTLIISDTENQSRSTANRSN